MEEFLDRMPAYLPMATSQSLTVLSTLTEAKVLPSGLNATATTAPVCPCRVAKPNFFIGWSAYHLRAARLSAERSLGSPDTNARIRRFRNA